MYKSIHMEGLLLVSLIKSYMNALFGPVIELFYRLSSRNQYFFTLCIINTRFMTNIYHQKIRKYIDDDRGGVFPKQQVKKNFISKYQLTYSNRYYVMKNFYIKDTRIHRTYSGKKKRKQVMSILMGHHIVMLKNCNSSDHVFMMQWLMLPQE